MDNAQFVMANRIAKAPVGFEVIENSVLQMWWGSRQKTTGKALLDALLALGHIEQVAVEPGQAGRVRLTAAGLEAVMAERRRRADLILAGEVAA